MGGSRLAHDQVKTRPDRDHSPIVHRRPAGLTFPTRARGPLDLLEWVRERGCEVAMCPVWRSKKILENLICYRHIELCRFSVYSLDRYSGLCLT